MASYSKKDLKRVRKIAEAQGWRVDQTRNGHWRFRSPDRSVAPVITGGTPGEGRAWANFIGALRRAGMDI